MAAHITKSEDRGETELYCGLTIKELKAPDFWIYAQHVHLTNLRGPVCTTCQETLEKAEGKKPHPLR
jgi:hypothetical protein